MDFDDQEDAIGSYELAYAAFNSFFRWHSSGKYLKAIASRDRSAAFRLVLRECYQSITEVGSGYDTPPIAATAMDLLDEPQLLEAIFNGFLQHCESLFAQLPQGDEYAWMASDAPHLEKDLFILITYSM